MNKSLSELLEDLNSSKTELRTDTTFLVAKLEDTLAIIGEPTVELLRAALASPSEAIRKGAAQALNRLGY